MAKRNVDDNNTDAVEAKQRFMTDPMLSKLIFSLVGAYTNALVEDDAQLDEAEQPELTRNERVLLLSALFDTLDMLIGGRYGETDEYESDDDYAEENASAKRSVETAKDKRMSTFYKAFMGDMRSLVGPWHSNKDKFLVEWSDLGNSLYAKSPAKKSDNPIRLEAIPEQEAEPLTVEEAAIIGGKCALPTKVARALASQGFTVLAEAEPGEAAWVKSGKEVGQPTKQLVLVCRDDSSYLVSVANINRHDPYGQPIKRRILGEGASAEAILQTIAMLYDEMAS